jgi:hypothetical protein
MMMSGICILAFEWWWPPVAAAIIASGSAGTVIVGYLIFRSPPPPPTPSLSLTGPATIPGNSISAPFTLTLTSSDPKVLKVGARPIVFTLTAVSPPPYEIARIIKMSDPNGFMQDVTPAVVCNGMTTSAGTIELVVQADGFGVVEMVAKDYAATKFASCTFEATH